VISQTSFLFFSQTKESMSIKREPIKEGQEEVMGKEEGWPSKGGVASGPEKGSFHRDVTNDGRTKIMRFFALRSLWFSPF
jgi:hypothetical protein